MDGTDLEAGGWRNVPVTEGEWAGWGVYGNDPFEHFAGPYYNRMDESGQPVCAFRTEPKHMNGGNFLHGGALMTFADHAIFVIAKDALQGSGSVTATFNCEFVGAVALGAVVECRGEVVKAGRSMVFVRALMTVEGEVVMSLSSVIKKTTRK